MTITQSIDWTGLLDPNARGAYGTVFKNKPPVDVTAKVPGARGAAAHFINQGIARTAGARTTGVRTTGASTTGAGGVTGGTGVGTIATSVTTAGESHPAATRTPEGHSPGGHSPGEGRAAGFGAAALDYLNSYRQNSNSVGSTAGMDVGDVSGDNNEIVNESGWFNRNSGNITNNWNFATSNTAARGGGGDRHLGATGPLSEGPLRRSEFEVEASRKADAVEAASVAAAKEREAESRKVGPLRRSEFEVEASRKADAVEVASVAAAKEREAASVAAAKEREAESRRKTAADEAALNSSTAAREKKAADAYAAHARDYEIAYAARKKEAA